MLLAIDGRELVPGRLTGIGRFLRGVLEEIARNRPCLQTVILALPETVLPLTAPHVRACRLPHCLTIYWDQCLLPRALREVRATAYFSPYYKAPILATCPTVVTIHDLIPVGFPEYTRGLGRVYAPAFRFWSAILARRAAAVVTDSEHSKADLVRLLKLRAESVHVIPIGVGAGFHPAYASEEAAVVAARYGISKAYLLCVSNFLPHKNLPRLVEAFSSLPEGVRANVQLVLAGLPGGHASARPVSRMTLDRPGVVIPGFIADEDLPILYAGATALVCPSLDEGFGLPVLEAMACGAPVVCARAGALPEVAGDAALYVDPTNLRDLAAGLQKILKDAALRRELARRGLARAPLFDAGETTARLVDLLEAVGSSGSGA